MNSDLEEISATSEISESDSEIYANTEHYDDNVRFKN